MSKGNPRGVYKQKEFDRYVVWRSLPPAFKGISAHQIQKMGFTEEEIIELMQIKTQKQFAEHFGIRDQGTLTDWNKKIKAENLLFPHTQQWARELTSNIAARFYKKIMNDPKAQDFAAWMKYIENR